MLADCTFGFAYGFLRGRWQNSRQQCRLPKRVLECARLRWPPCWFRSALRRCWQSRPDWLGMRFRLVVRLLEGFSRYLQDVSGRILEVDRGVDVREDVRKTPCASLDTRSSRADEFAKGTYIWSVRTHTASIYG